MNSIRSAAFLFSLAALVPLAPAAAATCPNSGLRIVPVAFQTAKGRFVYKVEVAATAEEQACGMMFRDRMAPGTGMAFPMQPPRATGFWMENTPLPLDIIYVSAAIFLMPMMGAAGFMIAVIAGQLIGSLIIDRFGLMGLVPKPFDLWRVLGAGLVLGGALLFQWPGLSRMAGG